MSGQPPLFEDLEPRPLPEPDTEADAAEPVEVDDYPEDDDPYIETGGGK